MAFRSAGLGYGDVGEIVSLDLTITEGEVVAVVGPNGSGKSTVIRSIFGLSQVQSGRVEIFGADRTRFRDWGRVGYVPQRGAVLGGIPSTVREVVTAGLVSGGHWFGRLSRLDRERVGRAISSVGLSEKADEPMATLSGGQQRRALIARALATDPDLLVLDEPTAGVDVHNQEVLAGILADLAGAGTTIVLVTHELGPARPIITRTVALRSGAVVYDGPEAGAPDEHDDAWHHEHGEPPTLGSGPGLDGFVS